MNAGVDTLSGILRKAAEDLRLAGVADAMADARILASSAFGLTREDMLREPHRQTLPEDRAALENMIRRRCDREPVGRILGRREFRSLEFMLGPDTLEPRPDSETIVEAGVAYGKRFKPSVRVLDIGTGTGCLLLAVLNELPTAHGVGIDISAGAIETATGNADRLGLSERSEFVCGNWTDGIDGTFDLVLSNPPYIETAEIAALSPEVSRHDPVRALDGGVDGLEAYREIAERLDRCLSPEGVAVLEIGATQRDAVSHIFAARGFDLVESRDDFGGHPRGLVFAAEPVPEWLTALGKKGLETP